jgi:NCS1 family nucleobase:cation symporter-1
MAIVWNGVNAVQGGQCIYVMLHALTPHIANIPNFMGKGSALDGGGFVGFIVFWILTCCFLVIPVPKVSPRFYSYHIYDVVITRDLIR